MCPTSGNVSYRPEQCIELFTHGKSCIFMTIFNYTIHISATYRFYTLFLHVLSDAAHVATCHPGSHVLALLDRVEDNYLVTIYKCRIQYAICSVSCLEFEIVSFIG